MDTPPTVVFDACVLHPAPLRDLLMWLATNGLIAARWSDRILAEWVESLLAKRADLKRERLRRTCSEMNRAVPDANTSDYETLIETITLPDPDDRHVAAVALASGASIILTLNVKDFPATQLPTGVCAQPPDSFLCELFAEHPTAVLETMREHRAMLQNPPKSAEEYLATLANNGLAQFVAMTSVHITAI